MDINKIKGGSKMKKIFILLLTSFALAITTISYSQSNQSCDYVIKCYKDNKLFFYRTLKGVKKTYQNQEYCQIVAPKYVRDFGTYYNQCKNCGGNSCGFKKPGYPIDYL